MCRLIYNALMPNRQIGVEVLIQDHFWSDEQCRYVYSFHCPACTQPRLTPELGIYRCDCGSWLIVLNHKSRIILGNLFTRSWVLSSKALKLRMTSLESLIHRVRERDDDAYEAIVRRFRDMAVG